MGYDDLPKVAKSHTQANESERSLESVLCTPAFISRKQAPDYGTDYDVELCVEEKATNIKFSVQLKSVERLIVNQDASHVSHAIECGRLHYLAKTLCGSLFVIYDVQSKNLFYEWVHILVRDLDANGIQWRDQDSVTIHVPITNVLDKKSAARIHDMVHGMYQRIRNSAKLIVDSTILVGGTTTDIPTNPLESKAPDELLALLEKNGVDLVASGLHREVIERYSSIPSVNWRNSAKHLLTIGSAYEHSGFPLQALTYVMGAKACGINGGLSIAEFAFAEHIEIVSKRNIGQLNHDQYNSALEKLAASYPDTDEALHARLERIFDLLLRSKDAASVDKLVAEARRLVTTPVDVPGLEQWGAHLLLARIECHGCDQQTLHGGIQVRMTDRSSHPMSYERRLDLVRRATDLNHAGFARLVALSKRAKEAERADLFATCFLEIATKQQSYALLSHIFTKQDANPPVSLADSENLRDALSRLETAIKIFGDLGMAGQRIRAVRQKADILNMMGRASEAVPLMDAAKMEAQALGQDIERFRFTEVPAFHDQSKADKDAAEYTDDQLNDFARHLHEGWGLPESRFPNVLKAVHAIRLIKQAQLSWCKHIELQDDTNHELRAETHYAVDPFRRCICALLGHKSSIPIQDAKVVIENFKSRYCVDCADRKT